MNPILSNIPPFPEKRQATPEVIHQTAEKAEKKYLAGTVLKNRAKLKSPVVLPADLRYPKFLDV
ncbi:hypothetical protein [uncultured Fretibacterium sp.]|uniref:hypothetical protein n=1 Tax=uncultured Fretibacterium sp. TaxID=1678694 RepID=UPI00261C5BC3|nr:hypothetical protein [uncultured Fretibacterium sp.]